MTPKELVKHFKGANWKNEEDVRFFIQTVPVDDLDARILSPLLDVLCNKRLSADTHVHTKRISVFSALASKCEDKGLFLAYVRAIKSGDARVRSLVVSLMPGVNNYDDHPKLCALLKSSSPEVRSTAAEALKAVGGKTVLQVIGKMVEERDFAGRSEAIDLVMPIAGHHAIPVLRAAVAVGKPPEQVKALKYLGDRKFMAKAISTALRAIVPSLEHKSEKIVNQAIVSFSNLAGEDAYFEYIEPFLEAESLNTVKAAVLGLGHFCSHRVVSALERKLRSGPNVIRMEVLTALEHIGNDEVLPALVEALGHKQVAVRNQAGEVLSRLSQARKLDVARVIIWLLHSQNVEVRRMAVEIAQKVKDPTGELWPKLLDFLRDEDWWVRERVMDALVQMAGRQLTPHMIGFLQDSFDVVRRFAVDVIMRLGDPQALGALVNTARDDKDWWTREKAIEAMASLKDERATPYIIDIMRRSPEVQFVCIQTLKDLDARSAAPYVAELLGSEDQDVRYIAVKCLGAFHAKEFVQQIQPLIADTDPHVAKAAREQLMYWQVELAEEYIATRDKAVSFLDKMLITVVEAEADDLILSSDRKPYMKRMGKTTPISNTVLTHDQINAIITPHLSLGQMEALQNLEDVDFSYEVKSEEARFRVNVFQQHSGLGAVYRTIKGELPSLEKLGLPEIVKSFGDLKYGLVIVGGPTGSGKSTTLAALIDYINRTSDRHVISLEDPIEVVHESKKGLVNQREVGTHTKTFSDALRATLREDPDVILVGEMRDLTTIKFAVTAAETGHLVFGTLHTVSADKSVDRLVNVFPAKEQPQVRATLSETLRAVVCQYLIKRADGSGRALASEIMLNTDAVANLIRKGKTYQIPSMVATSRELGMMSMDNELLRLFRAGHISAEDAYMRAADKKEFEEIVGEEAKDQALDRTRENVARSAGGKNTPGTPGSQQGQ
ncbi:MAG: PilT/PilU family type 4a pilus ATPase [Deltaproteobacteria bacterium]|nr:PilT/PilU family type 4a pilus ATPase [Deltaproteobacteria bacterium]